LGLVRSRTENGGRIFHTRRLPCDDDSCGWIALLPSPQPARRITSEQRADCVVVGAGFTGLALARRLATLRPEWRIVVVEAERVGFGASARNSGFVVDVGHYESKLGIEGNRRLTRLSRAGLEQLRLLVRTHAIDCAWVEGGRLHGAVGDLGMRCLERFCAGLEAMGEPYESLDAAAVSAITGSAYYRAAARTPGTVLMQPAALVRGLAAALPANVDLFEESPVQRIHRGRTFQLDAGDSRVIADRLFLSANGFTPELGFLRRQVFALLTFASLTRVLTFEEQARLGGEKEWGLVPEERMGTTVRRTRDQRLLIRNTVRYTSRLQVNGGHRDQIRETHRRSLRLRFPMLPEVDFEYTWGGVMGMSLNNAHFFGQLDERLFAAAGCNGVGVALGTISGTLLADLALGEESALLRDMQALPRPAWIPPQPLLALGVRATLARASRRASEEL
jgi:glycine/D-amino acid oxidase-like deaminating enzyme